MTASEMFEGFAEHQVQYEAVLVDRYGEGVREHFPTAEHNTTDWKQEDYLEAQRRGDEVDQKVLDVMRSGAAPH